MRKENFNTPGLNIVVLVLMLMAYSCSSPSAGSPSEPVAAEEPKATMHSVEMIQMKFYPAELKVKKGDKVVFVNHDLVTHDVTEESQKLWSSSPMIADQTWVLTVSETVSYYCSIHPVMKGKIIVE